VHSSPPSLPPFLPSSRVAAGETEAPDLKLRNGEDISLVQDLITLPHLHEPAILHSLQERFEEGAIYTFTGKEGEGMEGGRLEATFDKWIRFQSPPYICTNSPLTTLPLSPSLPPQGPSSWLSTPSSASRACTLRLCCLRTLSRYGGNEGGRVGGGAKSRGYRHSKA